MRSARVDIIKKFCDTSLTFEQLASEVRVEDFVDLRRDAFKGCVLFGVNVRTSSNLDNVFPFFYSSISQKLELKVAPELTLPKFSDKFGIEDLSFIAINDIDSLSIVLQGGSFENDKEITEFLSNDKSFVKEQLKVLQQHSENKIFYYWVASEDYDISRGGAFLANILAVSDCREDIEQCKSRYLALCKLIFLLKARYSFEIEREKHKESIKSAVAAIMTRNMSHNLGSHYLYYTKNHLEKLAAKGGEFGPDIRGAARTLGYIQARMDYLSTMISNDRYPYAGVNFKSQIFDELTIDDFSKRHFETENISVAHFNDIVEKILFKTKKLDILFDDYKDDELADIPNYISSAKNILEELSGDIVSIRKGKECNRTTNFLLSNLILSEQYSRKGILDDKGQGNLNLLKLRVVLIDKDGSQYAEFTGEHSATTRECDTKLKLSRLYIGLPGGVMSCHAFFNVLENFIRNSAKYLQDKINRKDLVITIAIKDNGGFYEFIIYDNKCNANIKIDNNFTLVEQLNNRLSNIRILDDNGSVEKSNKGFKEMIFSTIWMRSYMYTSEKKYNSLSDLIVDIDSTRDSNQKLEKINRYAFTLVTVNDNGSSIYVNRDEIDSCLGLKFELPKFHNCVQLNLSNSVAEIKNASLNLFGDIIEVDANECGDFVNNIKLNQWFPRLVFLVDMHKDVSIVDKFKYVLNKRFGNIDNYQLSFGNTLNIDDQYKIYFRRHLSTGVQDMSSYKGYAYADSVSGGNFTITLQELYYDAIKNIGDIDSEYLMLKIKESALTRITFIDERLYKEMRSQHKEVELACKNIRVLDLIINNEFDERVLSISADDNNVFQFTGNQFNDENDDTHFVSIHLGLIEKIVEKFNLSDELKDLIIQNGVEEVSSEEKLLNYKVDMFMRGLRLAFGNNVFISIHSGRGNFSKELEGPLKSYPFIAMAAIENAYNNSKYLLSQLFYNTVYIGKGELNSKN